MCQFRTSRSQPSSSAEGQCLIVSLVFFEIRHQPAEPRVCRIERHQLPSGAKRRPKISDISRDRDQRHQQISVRRVLPMRSLQTAPSPLREHKDRSGAAHLQAIIRRPAFLYRPSPPALSGCMRVPRVPANRRWTFFSICEPFHIA